MFSLQIPKLTNLAESFSEFPRFFLDRKHLQSSLDSLLEPCSSGLSRYKVVWSIDKNHNFVTSVNQNHKRDRQTLSFPLQVCETVAQCHLQSLKTLTKHLT